MAAFVAAMSREVSRSESVKCPSRRVSDTLREGSRIPFGKGHYDSSSGVIMTLLRIGVHAAEEVVHAEIGHDDGEEGQRHEEVVAHGVAQEGQ